MSTVRVDEGGTVGTSIDFEDDLGLDDETGSVTIDVSFLLGRRHQIDLLEDLDTGSRRFDETGRGCFTKRITPGRVDSVFFLDDVEARGFQAWSCSIYSSALCANGQLDGAELQNARARSLIAHQAPLFAKAEVLRREALMELQRPDLARVQSLSKQAIEIFDSIDQPTRSALAHIAVGNAHFLARNAGKSLIEFAIALQKGAQDSGRRADRVTSIAAANMAACVARSGPTDASTAYAFVCAARDTMKTRHLGVAKVAVRWSEAVIAYRFGSDKFALRRLRKVRDDFLKVGSLRQALCSITDLLFIARETDRSGLCELARESIQAFREALERAPSPPDDLRQALETWASRPSDVEALQGSFARFGERSAPGIDQRS